MAESRKRREIARSELVAQLRALGVAEGGVLLVHTSFRATGPVEGGPDGLIRALQDAVGADGTLVMPSWPGDGDAPFDPRSTAAASDLGVVADTFWRLPSVRRSGHPHAFAAAGPHADPILADPLPLPPHRQESPVGRVHDLDGQVLLLGVDHDANTTIHLAELAADVPYRVMRRCTIIENGSSKRVEYGENDHCCEHFRLVGTWLRERGLQSEGRIGHGHSRLARSQDIVQVTCEQLEPDPLLFLHAPERGCIECDEARASVPTSRER